MKTAIIFLNILLLNIAVFSQKVNRKTEMLFEKYFDQSYQYLVVKEYNKALPLLLKMDSLKPNNSNVNYKLGLCLYNSINAKESLKYFKIAVLNVSDKYKEDYYKDITAPLKSYYYLAKSYNLNYEFKNAIDFFELYKTNLSNDNVELINSLNRDIEICLFAEEQVKKQIDVKFHNLGIGINSINSEYAPIISNDGNTLIFTARKFKNDNTLENEDIYISKKENDNWSKAKKIDSLYINTPLNEACLSLSADGRKLLIYRNDGKTGDLYESLLIGDNWTVPQKLSDAINSESNEINGCYSPDGDIIYFTSDRPGGLGGTDIYQSNRLPSGKWSLPVNMGDKINTSYNETMPFIANDKVSLFFSSQGHDCMGGYDIFKTTLQNGEWSEPQNIGFPINTTGDDYFYVTSSANTDAYYATSGRGDSYGNYDIYRLEYPKAIKVPVQIVKGRLKNVLNEVILDNASISAYDYNTNERIGEYKPNSLNGKFLFILNKGTDAKVTYKAQGYLTLVERLTVNKDTSSMPIIKEVFLKQIEKGLKEQLDDLEYDVQTKNLTKVSYFKIDYLAELLKNNANLKISLDIISIEDDKVYYIPEISNIVIKDFAALGVNTNQIILKKQKLIKRLDDIKETKKVSLIFEIQ